MPSPFSRPLKVSSCPPNLPQSASGADLVNAINACANGTGGGGAGFPPGTPPAIGGFSSTNIPESETVSGDCSFSRAGLGSYTITCSKSGGATFGTDAFLGAGTGLISSGGNLNISPTSVTAGSYTNSNITVNAQGQVTSAANGTAGGGGSVSSVGLAAPSDFSVSGSPITATGSLTFTHAGQTCTTATCSVTTGNVKCDATSNNVEVDLPSSTGSYVNIHICKIDSSVNTCTVKPSATTINGAATQVLNSQYQCVNALDVG